MDMPELGDLVQNTAEYLRLFLPTLAKAGDKAAEGAGKKVGEETAAKLLKTLGPETEKVARTVAEDRDDADAIGALRFQLKSVLKSNEELALAVAKMLEEAGARTSATVTGSGAVAQHGSAAAGEGGTAVVAQGPVYINSSDTPPDSTDRDALRRAYLYRVMEETGHVPLAGVDPAVSSRDAKTRIELQAVYTALFTQTPRDSEHGEEGLRRHLREGRERPLSALEQLDRHDRLVLLGDPGSGKSTFVSFVALCLAGEALGRDDVNLGLLRAPLPTDDEAEAEPQPWSGGCVIPVRVVLRDFAAQELKKGEEASASSLWEFMKKELEKAKLGAFAEPLERELQEKGGMLLLDGLDEVPEANDRRQRIKEAVADFAKSFPRCRMLVTSRTYAYQHQEWRLPGFPEATLAPFGEAQIRRFVDRWYVHAASLELLPEAEARGRAELLKRAIFGSERLGELAERPLLLTLMASLHSWRGGSLPDRRERLYADTVDLLLDFWESRRIKRDPEGKPIVTEPSLAEWLQVDREKVRRVLESLAYEAHASQPDLQGTADIPQGELLGRLTDLRKSTEENPAKLVRYLSQRAGILEPRGVGVFTFPHRTFQEYLAACHLTGGGFDEDEIARLGREDPNRWREVVLLAAAKGAAGSEANVWHLVSALCERDAADAEAGEADAWGAHLAAQALVESTRREGLTRRRERELERVREWLVRLLRSEHLPAIERALAGENLAKIGDPRFEPEHWYLPMDPMLGFVEVPEGTFSMGSDDDEEAYGKETPKHEVSLPSFYISRFPVTVQQFKTFVDAIDLEDFDRDSLDGHPNHPVVWVSWHDAMAYCCWLGTELRGWAKKQSFEQGSKEEKMWRRVAEGELGVCLPSEAEWEKAARGTDGRIYPWGNEADSERANYNETGLGSVSTVGCFSKGVSPYGVEEMSGNVWEWTRNLWGKEYSSIDKRFEYPYNFNNGSEEIKAPDTILRVLRGGSAWTAAGTFVSRFAAGSIRAVGASTLASASPSPHSSLISEVSDL